MREIFITETAERELSQRTEKGIHQRRKYDFVAVMHAHDIGVVRIRLAGGAIHGCSYECEAAKRHVRFLIRHRCVHMANASDRDRGVGVLRTICISAQFFGKRKSSISGFTGSTASYRRYDLRNAQTVK